MTIISWRDSILELSRWHWRHREYVKSNKNMLMSPLRNYFVIMNRRWSFRFDKSAVIFNTSCRNNLHLMNDQLMENESRRIISTTSISNFFFRLQIFKKILPYFLMHNARNVERELKANGVGLVLYASKRFQQKCIWNS